MRFKTFDRLRDWWHGTDDTVPDQPKDTTPAYGESDEDEPVDECPMGGDHDVVEIRASTNQGQPLARYCRRCREDL